MSAGVASDCGFFALQLLSFPISLLARVDGALADEHRNTGSGLTVLEDHVRSEARLAASWQHNAVVQPLPHWQHHGVKANVALKMSDLDHRKRAVNLENSDSLGIYRNRFSSKGRGDYGVRTLERTILYHTIP